MSEIILALLFVGIGVALGVGGTIIYYVMKHTSGSNGEDSYDTLESEKDRDEEIELEDGYY